MRSVDGAAILFAYGFHSITYLQSLVVHIWMGGAHEVQRVLWSTIQILFHLRERPSLLPRRELVLGRLHRREPPIPSVVMGSPSHRRSVAIVL